LRHVLAVGAGRPDIAKVTRYLGTILRTEAIGEFANGGITWWCSIRIRINIASVLIGTVITVLLAIAEKASFNAVAISTGQEVLLTQWFISEEEGFNFFFFGLGIAIFNGSLPITSLFLNVKG